MGSHIDNDLGLQAFLALLRCPRTSPAGLSMDAGGILKLPAAFGAADQGACCPGRMAGRTFTGAPKRQLRCVEIAATYLKIVNCLQSDKKKLGVAPRAAPLKRRPWPFSRVDRLSQRAGRPPGGCSHAGPSPVCSDAAQRRDLFYFRPQTERRGKMVISSTTARSGN